jgi:hypothetical protein
MAHGGRQQASRACHICWQQDWQALVQQALCCIVIMAVDVQAADTCHTASSLEQVVI